jgi:predicted GIY-YIG superfamily endonuclease
MKDDVKTGDDHYRNQGLVRIVAWVDKKVARSYERKMKQLAKKQKHSMSRRQFFTYWFTVKAPRG